MNKGRDFETLVATVERAFHNLPGTEVIHNTKLKPNNGSDKMGKIRIKGLMLSTV